MPDYLTWNIHVPGALAQNVNARWVVPYNCQVVQVSASGSNDSDATIQIGTSTDTNAILVASNVGDNGIPIAYDTDDWDVVNPVGALGKGEVLALVVDYDGPAGTAVSDLTVSITAVRRESDWAHPPVGFPS